MADLDEKTSSVTAKLIGASSTGVETNFIGSTAEGEIYSKISPEPLYNILPRRSSLTNTSSGSENLNVNGLITPQTYRFTPDTGETWFLDNLIMMIADAGSTAYGNFGAGLALLNGVLIEVRSKGVSHQIANVRTNAELTMVFSGGAGGSSGGLIGSGTWLNESDLYIGSIGFSNPIILQNSTSDYLQVTIRDNLSTIDLFKMFYNAFKRNA